MPEINGRDARLRELKRKDPDRHYAEIRERARWARWVEVRARFHNQNPKPNEPPLSP